LEGEAAWVSVTVRPAGQEDAGTAGQVELAVQRAAEDQWAAHGETRRLEYRGIWRPQAAGRWVLGVRGVSGELVEEVVEVVAAGDERRYVPARHGELARLAEQTGGAVVPPHELGKLAQWVPHRARRTADDQRRPLWDSPWVLAWLVGLLGIEWAGRRWMRLA